MNDAVVHIPDDQADHHSAGEEAILLPVAPAVSAQVIVADECKPETTKLSKQERLKR